MNYLGSILQKCFGHIHQFMLLGMLLASLTIKAQFAPPAEMPGSTAIPAESPQFVNWASGCIIEAGFLDISNELLGFVTYGLPEYATQMADNQVVSLGDKGMATCFFDVPLANGEGWDFAVFENSFDDTFLELAFVEVSSDGEFFVRFEATSLTQTETQTETFGVLDATQINNLAGKYRGGYGVPFDLQELIDIDGLDINHIIAVRIIDVVGNIQPEWRSEDALGHPINDPWPTAFETGGFDLDAVGVIHNQNNTDVVQFDEKVDFLLYPNPLQSQLFFESDQVISEFSVHEINGKQLFQASDTKSVVVETECWSKGLYVVKVQMGSNIQIAKLVK